MKKVFLIFFTFLVTFFKLVLPYKVCNILALGGGGSFGAVEVGILKDIIEKKILKPKFDVITGISAGALNGAYLAQGNNIIKNIDELEQIYKNIKTKDIYFRQYNKVLSNWCLFNNSPLENTIRKIIINKKFTNSSPLTLIGATNINTQKLDIFKFNNLNEDLQVDILMATSAIPILFKPRRINNDLYVDGGTIENEILYQVINEYKADYYNFTYISSTNKQDKYTEINNLLDYTITISSLLVNNYIYDIAKIKDSYFDCKRGKINIFYPTSERLNNYNILDFDSGEDLIKIAKESYNFETINFC